MRNVLKQFSIHLDSSPCEPLASDMKVKVEGNYYYPDVLVDCTDGSSDDT